MCSDLSLCDAAKRIVALTRDAGACAVGFAAARTLDHESILLYNNWISGGCHGEMRYLENHADLRTNPALVLPGARTVLCAAFPYVPEKGLRSDLFADYALGDDYHEVLRRRLEPVARELEAIVPDSSTRICVDTAPVRERCWAVKAGLGFIGLNCQLILPGIGSGVFLAEILWTGDEWQSPPCPQSVCKGCLACVKACPGRALDGCGGMDARRCLSYLTIEHRGALPDELSLAGKRIYGCDICRDVCPHNPSRLPEALPEFAPRSSILSLDIEGIRHMEQTEFSAIFTHSAVKRAKLAGLKRNAGKA